MITHSALLEHARKVKASSASTIVRELCDLILALEPPQDVGPLLSRIRELEGIISDRDAKIAALSSSEPKSRGRPAMFGSDEERKRHRREYMRKWREGRDRGVDK